MKILFAVDGSPQALAALETLVEKFGFFRETPKLTLINVHPPVPYKVAASWVGKEAIDRYYDDESEAALASARKLLALRGIPFEVDKRVGVAPDEIVARAGSGSFDIIAMGTHGHTALANLVMGSVATRVLASSKVPVLLMK